MSFSHYYQYNKTAHINKPYGTPNLAITNEGFQKEAFRDCSKEYLRGRGDSQTHHLIKFLILP